MKFNQKTTGVTSTTNYDGAKAYTLSPELELYSLVCTSILEPKFYETDESQLERLQGLVPKVSPEFVARLAIYAREKMYLRLIPQVLAVELAAVHNGDNLVSKVVERVVQRPDEITEMLAYYKFRNGSLKKLSKQIQKGLRNSFGKFDEYQLAKYNRKAEVTLRDAVFLTHPKGELIQKIADGTLETPYTWEVRLSEAGKNGEDKKKVWEELIRSGKLGYMAMLRNLRNMVEAGVDMRPVAEKLADPEAVRKSKQLPFRFLSAYLPVQDTTSFDTNILFGALEKAAKISIENLQGFDEERVVIACDTSRSMQHAVSSNSSVQLYDIGILLGMALQSKSRRVITGMFGDFWKVVQMPHDNILRNTVEYREKEGEVGYSTNGYLVLRDLEDRGIEADRIMFFTDMQLWDSDSYGTDNMADAWHSYKSRYPGTKLYLFDLAGYGTTPISTAEKDVFLISGWSDKVFEALNAYENGAKNLEFIKNIAL